MTKISNGVEIDMDDREGKMQLFAVIEDSENEAVDGDDNQVNEIMDIEEVIGASRCGIVVSDRNLNKRQDRRTVHDKVNRDRMIFINGVMKYEGEDNEMSNFNNKNDYRFKRDYKGNIILIASVKKEKLVKEKVGNAIRIATKTMRHSSNKIIRIKHLGYNKSEIHFKDIITANKFLEMKDGDRILRARKN